jgi:hypothetical protein
VYRVFEKVQKLAPFLFKGIVISVQSPFAHSFSMKSRSIKFQEPPTASLPQALRPGTRRMAEGALPQVASYLFPFLLSGLTVFFLESKANDKAGAGDTEHSFKARMEKLADKKSANLYFEG